MLRVGDSLDVGIHFVLQGLKDFARLIVIAVIDLVGGALEHVREAEARPGAEVKKGRIDIALGKKTQRCRIDPAVDGNVGGSGSGEIAGGRGRRVGGSRLRRQALRLGSASGWTGVEFGDGRGCGRREIVEPRPDARLPLFGESARRRVIVPVRQPASTKKKRQSQERKT